MLQDPRVAREGDKWDVGGASGVAASRDGNLVRDRFAAKMKTPLLFPSHRFLFCLVSLLFLLIFCVSLELWRKRVDELNWNLLEKAWCHWAGLASRTVSKKRAVYPCYKRLQVC
jgi:hypothetical protein